MIYRFIYFKVNTRVQIIIFDCNMFVYMNKNVILVSSEEII